MHLFVLCCLAAAEHFARERHLRRPHARTYLGRAIGARHPLCAGSDNFKRSKSAMQCSKHSQSAARQSEREKMRTRVAFN